MGTGPFSRTAKGTCPHFANNLPMSYYLENKFYK